MVGPPPDTWAVNPESARAFELVPDLWRLRLPLPWPAIPAVNAYALSHPDGGVVLIDCGGGGDPTCRAALEIALNRSGHEVEDVREVVLTHYHSDHAGPLEWLAERSGCVISGHADHAHFTDASERPDEIEAARRRRAGAEGVPAELLEMYSDVREERDGVDSPFHPRRALREGDTVVSVHGTWRVLETPGHCPSHICLYQPETGILFVGDVLAPDFRPWFDYGYSPDPVGEMNASLDRLDALTNLTLVLPGHGRPLADVAGILALHRSGLADRQRAVREAVADGAQTGLGVTHAVFGDELPPLEAVWRLGETICYLRHDRLAGRIERKEENGRFRYELATDDPAG
jgi:glyoxylase-like metal-dependent hydrolase (beta-lactamase superfamily II)